MFSVRDDGLVLDDPVQVGDGFLDLHSLAEAGCFITVLVVGSQVGNSAFSSYRQDEIRVISDETYIWWARLAV